MAEYSNSYNLSNELLSFKKSIASNNRQAIDKYLCQIKNLPEDFLNQALFWCIENYKVQQQTDECLHVLLRYTSEITKSKANPNCQINLQTPLIAACKKGQLSLVKRLIENGAKPDLTNSEHKHPLEFVLNARQQNYDVAEYLIGQIHSVNLLTKNKHPILIAVEKEFCRIFKALLQKGSELMFEDGNLLHFIMKQKFKNIKKKKKFLKQLTTKHTLFTQLDKDGKTPIEYEENQEIKTYYLQNFKVKKAPEPLVIFVQKIQNNSSIFINLKSSKKDQRLVANERKKNLNDSVTLISKQTKEGNKEIKALNKQCKDDQGSFQEEAEDKSQGQIQEDEKQPEKITKINNQNLNSVIQKKSTTNATKANLNSSFVFNTSTSNYNKETTNSVLNNSTTSKLKSKYSSIGPKTETNLKNFNKRVVETSKHDNKKSFGTNTKNSEMNTKKKSPHQDQKKQFGSNKKIHHAEQKNPNDLSGKYHPEINKHQIEEENEKNLQQNCEQTEINDLEQKNTQTFEQTNTEIQEAILKQTLICVETIQLNQTKEQIKLSGKQEDIKPTKKSEWELALEACEKLMEQFIIKEENEITDLKELKAKLNQTFSQYTSKINISHLQTLSQPEKLREIKILTNQSHKTTFILPNKTSNQQKQSLKVKYPSINILTEQILIIEANCFNCSQQKTDYINQAIQLISKRIHTVLQSTKKDKIQVSIETYGSRANGLEIQTSDIDLLIICNINAGVKDLMLQLQRGGAFNCSEINEAKFLANTSMPIMKLGLNSNFNHLSIDLTFQVRGHTGIRCTSLIKQFIDAENLLKPLVITLKTLLNSYELCDTYTGGLGSYSLTLMTIALLQFTEIKKIKENLGEIFLEFLLFYGFQMDYVCQAIIIHPPGFNERPAFSIYQLPYSLDLTPKLIIYDPLNPVNNVGRATYRIVQLKKLFKIWYVKLRTELSGRKDGLQELMRMKDELLKRTATIQE